MVETYAIILTTNIMENLLMGTTSSKDIKAYEECDECIKEEARLSSHTPTIIQIRGVPLPVKRCLMTLRIRDAYLLSLLYVARLDVSGTLAVASYDAT